MTYEFYLDDGNEMCFLKDRNENFFQTSNFTIMLHWVGIMLDAFVGTDTQVGVMVSPREFNCNENIA